MAPAARQLRSQVPLSEQPGLRDLRHGSRAYVVLWQVDGGTGREEGGEGGRPYPGTKCWPGPLASFAVISFTNQPSRTNTP
jgi:hypothetical protein